MGRKIRRHLIPADEKLIFDGDPETKWDLAMARRKIKT